MSVYASITLTLHQRQRVLVEVTEDGIPVDLRGKNLQWRLLRQVGDVLYVDKQTGSGVDVDPEIHHRAVIDVFPSDYMALEPGFAWHELWDQDSRYLLVYGDVTLFGATEPSAP